MVSAINYIVELGEYMGNVKLEPEEYTWHHSLETGRMQLVHRGVHNSVTHNGGRTPGEWAEANR